MRVIISFFVIVISGFTIHEARAQEVNWVSFEEAVELSKKEPKKILIDLYTDWCGWCKRMDRDTYAKADIIAEINKNFYAVKFNAEQKEPVQLDDHTFKFVASGRRGYHELAAALANNKMSYPTTVFMDEEIRIIQPISGYMNAEDMMPILKFIGEDHFKKTSWEEFVALEK